MKGHNFEKMRAFRKSLFFISSHKQFIASGLLCGCISTESAEKFTHPWQIDAAGE